MTARSSHRAAPDDKTATFLIDLETRLYGTTRNARPRPDRYTLKSLRSSVKIVSIFSRSAR